MPTQTLVRKVSGKTIPVLKSRISTRKFRLSKDAADDGSTSHDLQQWLKRKQSVWPADNLNPFVDKVSEQQEEVVQVLQANNPQLAKNLVEFSFKEKAYVPVTYREQHITLLEVEGTCLHIESPEAKEKIDAMGSTLINENKGQKNIVDVDNDSLKDVDEDEIAEDVDDDELRDAKDEKYGLKQGIGGKTKKLMNQFNYCERATITYDNALKEAGNQTNPIEKAIFCDYVTQWIIYDSYQEDFENQEKDKDKEKKEKSAAALPPPPPILKKDDVRKLSQTDHSEEMYKNIAKKASILERMINQNMFDDILQDFRYYEDPSDEFRNNQGTLLPLWKLQLSEIKKLCVTDITWNPRYFDLFGITLGTFNFQKQSTVGCFCLWSLKNPSYPEYINFTRSGVMCLDFHPTRSYLIAIGQNDGIVAVYDTRTDAKIPLYESNDVDNKHGGIVWQIQWGTDLTAELTFYSISSDGNVFSWILMQNRLSKTLVISLDAELTSRIAINDEINNLKDSGTCIVLHPIDHTIFLIGTEEGAIYKCSTAYLSFYLFVYEAHQMPVQRIDYNKFNPNIFASCSADWSIKVWEDCRKEPLFVFDTASSVGDVGWAPYSSSVLAAVCLDCKVYVYDLNVDKYKAVCVQAVSSKKINKLTRLSFNWKLPVIVVGDDKGVCQVLKLSPNLRIKPKVTKKLQNVDLRELEIVKLEKLLSLIREPSELLAQIDIGQSSDSSSQ